MDIILNGKSYPVAPGMTVAALIEQLALGEKRLALEVNAAIVPRSAYPEHTLRPGDKVEIIHAVGGG